MNFKAWNKKTKKMYYIDGFRKSLNTIYRSHLATSEFRTTIQTIHYVEDNLNDYELIESTGLHDGKGREIYVNDILKVQSAPHFPEHIGIAIPLKEIQCIENIKTGNEIQLEDLYYEVIGNSYENPELAKGSGYEK